MESRPKLRKEVMNARLTLLEFALIGFVEQVEGKVPIDEEILKHGFHIRFSNTPLTVFEKDGKQFVDYYVWKCQYVLAHGFLNPKDLLELSVVQLPESPWPPALCAAVQQREERKGEG
jgi:hypothetical protein